MPRLQKGAAGGIGSTKLLHPSRIGDDRFFDQLRDIQRKRRPGKSVMRGKRGDDDNAFGAEPGQQRQRIGSAVRQPEVAHGSGAPAVMQFGQRERQAPYPAK